MTSTKWDSNQIKQAIILACDWLADVAQVQTDTLPPDTIDSHSYPFASWKGVIRSHYTAATREWDFMGPTWHTGQAVKALHLAARFFGRDKYRHAARAAAHFILANQVYDPAHPDHGLMLAYEDFGDKVNTSAILESMDGLILLAAESNDADLWDRLIASGDFILKHLYMSHEGLFRDVYDPKTHSVLLPNPYPARNNIGGRPLVDDAIFLRLYEKTGNRAFLDAHVKTSESLVAHQNPPGNWIDYGPCNARTGAFHPRHTYWWGLPLIDTFRATGRKEFLETAIASGEFCQKAMRTDGGWFRGLYRDFNTDSFGHATSGSACAAILWLELYKETKDPRWLPPARKALEYCLSVQFTAPQDPNLKGAVLEKVLPPGGSDRSPYFLRDLGTIFFILAALNYLQTAPT